MPSAALAMLLAVCACAALAAVRALASDEIPAYPVFSNQYYVTGVQNDLIRGYRIPFSSWFDLKNERVRTDVTALRDSVINSRVVPSQWITVYPNTTETHLNQWACQVYYAEAWLLLSLMPYIGPSSTFLGKERVHGTDAYRWRTQLTTNNVILDTWMTYRNSTGGRNPVVVPVRFEVQQFSFQGYLTYHYTNEYYDYEVYDGGLDPEIFNISKGFQCKEEYYPPKSSVMNHFNLLFTPSFSGDSEFDLYKTRQNKQYASRDEHEKRMNIYRENVEFIEKHNRGNHSYKLAVNEFADRTPEELRAMQGYRPPGRSSAAKFPHSKAEVEELSKDLPEKFDWRWTPGVVKQIKNNYGCFANYAFAAVGAIEGVNAIVNGGYRPQLSDQALIDCSWGFQNNGCYGGSYVGAFEYVKKHGIPTYGSYGEYLSEINFCHVGNITDLIHISDFHAVTPNDTNALKVAIFKNGPVAVMMEEHVDFVFYSYGIYNHPGGCFTGDAIIAVLVVGWGELEGQKYWIVKNSLGNQWGINGYALVAMDNDCGLTSMPYYVTIDKHTD